MIDMHKIFISLLFLLGACTQYHSPNRETWQNYLYGASFTDMTEDAKIAKRPIHQGNGGKIITDTTQNVELEYGDKTMNDTIVSVQYMKNLENTLYDTLRKPGISVQRAGTDVVIILLRDAIMELNAPEISENGAQTLRDISRILKKHDATFMEIAGYTDAMRDYNAANALSLDMAERIAVYLSQSGIKTTRMFIIGRGAARPIAPQDSWGRLTNRRVEIRLTPVR